MIVMKRRREILLTCSLIALAALATEGQHAPAMAATPHSYGPIRLAVTDSTRLTVCAYWEPITECMDNFHRKWEELRDLRAAEPVRTYRGSDFRAFLPPGPAAAGDIWPLEKEPLLRFLRQFHPGATLDLHINNGDSPGAYACLRAYNSRLAEIIFRIHAGFVLKGGFFTPGQFTGRLVLDRRSGDVRYFRLYLPPAPINFDVNMRLAGSSEGEIAIDGGTKRVSGPVMVTDAGSVPRMELVGGDDAVTRRTRWQAAVSTGKAHARLAARFYRWTRIQWVEFDQALAIARRTGKPLHVVAVDGTLTDESC